MSLIHALRHEVKPIASSSNLPRRPDSHPAAPVEQARGTQPFVEINQTPREGQTVFEQSLPSRTTKSRRAVITVLLVLANLVQV